MNCADRGGRLKGTRRSSSCSDSGQAIGGCAAGRLRGFGRRSRPRRRQPEGEMRPSPTAAKRECYNSDVARSIRRDEWPSRWRHSERRGRARHRGRLHSRSLAGPPGDDRKEAWLPSACHGSPRRDGQPAARLEHVRLGRRMRTAEDRCHLGSKPSPRSSEGRSPRAAVEGEDGGRQPDRGSRPLLAGGRETTQEGVKEAVTAHGADGQADGNAADPGIGALVVEILAQCMWSWVKASCETSSAASRSWSTRYAVRVTAANSARKKAAYSMVACAGAASGRLSTDRWSVWKRSE